MNAKRSLRGVLIAATAGLVVILAATAAGGAAAKTGAPEVQMQMRLAGSGAAVVGAQNRAAEQVKNEERELLGVVTALDDSSITVDGVKIRLNAMTEVKASLKVGDEVKALALRLADGSYLAREVEKTGMDGSHLEHPGGPLGVGGEVGHHPEPEQEVHHSTTAADDGHHGDPDGHDSGHHE